MANALPDQPPEASRRRQRFVVERVWREGARYTGVEVRIDEPDFLASYTMPGQYVTFQYGPIEPRFLVIASGPTAEQAGAERWEFLIDRDSDLGDVVDKLKPSHRVVLSPPEGSGYPAGDVAGGSVLIFTTGAGIASVRPVMEYWGDRPELTPAKLAIYYGENDLVDFAYSDEFGAWRAMGARLYQAVENLPEPEEGFRYVQHAFEADEPELDQTQVFISGAPVMMELVIARLLRLGVPPEHLFVNV
jgi:sulfhydrogenase subunit gamma (sulfur reductase)